MRCVSCDRRFTASQLLAADLREMDNGRPAVIVTCECGACSFSPFKFYCLPCRRFKSISTEDMAKRIDRDGRLRISAGCPSCETLLHLTVLSPRGEFTAAASL